MTGHMVDTHVIVAGFSHQRFAALVPRPTRLGIKDISSDLWPYPKGELTTAKFSGFAPRGSTRSYDGSITISNMGFELPELDYDATQAVDVIDTGHNLIALPTIKLEAVVKIENMEPTVLNTLRWYADLTNDIDTSAFYKDLQEFVKRTIDCLHTDPAGLPEFFSEFKAKETKMKFITRKAQEDPTKLATDVLRIERTVDPGGALKALMSYLSNAALQGTLDQEDIEEAVELLKDAQQTLASPIVEEDEGTAIELRLRKYYAILGALREMKEGKRRMPQGVDPDAARVFAEDLYSLLISFWNRIVRYLKYEESQYWLNEYPEYGSGLFFIRNRVTLDGDEIVPYGTAQVRQEILRENLIDLNRWEGIAAATKDERNLREREIDWTVSGILSQALSHLVANELLSAIVLSCVALEEAMTMSLHHVDPENYDAGGLGAKAAKVKDLIGCKRVGYDRSAWENDWTFLQSGEKETGMGLIQIRQRLQHPEVGMSKAIPERSDVAKRVLAAQRMCRALLDWDRKQKLGRSRNL